MVMWHFPDQDDPVVVVAWTQGFHDGYKVARRGGIAWADAKIGVLSQGCRLACPRGTHPYSPGNQPRVRHEPLLFQGEWSTHTSIEYPLCYRCANYWGGTHAGWVAAGGPITDTLANNLAHIERDLVARGWRKPTQGGPWDPPRGGKPDAEGSGPPI